MTNQVQLYARDVALGSTVVVFGMTFFIWLGLFLAYKPLTPEIRTELETYLSSELSSTQTPVTITELNLKRDYWKTFYGTCVDFHHCLWSSETFYMALGKYTENGIISRLELRLYRNGHGPLYLDQDSTLNERFTHKPNWTPVR